MPKRKKKKIQPKSVPKLIGSCNFVGRDDTFKIVVLIFMCDQDEQEKFQESDFAVVNQLVCVWRSNYPESVIIFDLSNEGLKKLKYKTLQRRIGSSGSTKVE